MARRPDEPVIVGPRRGRPQRPTHSGMRGPNFRPWQPDLTPPLGFYDPTLDANLGAAGRGLFDTEQDIERQRGRITSDYGLGLSNIQRGYDRGLEDIGASRGALATSRDRAMEDIGTRRQQGTEDYGRSVADLQLAYQRKSNSQRQAMNARGVLHGGAALQAAEKRTANQARDRQPLDTAFSRLTSGLDQAASRTGEDFSTQTTLLDRQQGRLGEDRNLQLGELALNYAPPDESNPFGGRAFQDLATSLARAKREGAAFELDTAAAKAAQASANGWNPAMTKTVKRGGMVYTIDPKGRILSKRKAGR